MDTFRALVVDKIGDSASVSMQDWTEEQLMAGEVTIAVEYSSVNYKDGLATQLGGNVARVHPLVLGIDMAGKVLRSEDARYKAGDRVIAHAYDLGVAHHGGLAERARVPAGWVVPLPAGLSGRQAMAVGTAGFTAAMSVEALERMGVTAGTGSVLVTGASGGVGSTAIALLAARGHRVVASTGRPSEHEYLKGLGAAEFVARAETTAESTRPLEKGRWAGIVDAVGGPSLAYALRTTAPGGSIAVSGNAGGAEVHTSVYPFILRGVNVLGIDSANLAIEKRIALWNRIATDLRPPHLEESIAREVTLTDAPSALAAIVRGEVRGRTVVRIGG